jgi:hypothetical protein
MRKLLTLLPQISLTQLRLTLLSTTAGTCRRDLEFFHRPHGEIDDALGTRLTLAQLQTTLRSTTVGECHETYKSSHRPHGKMADVLAPTHAFITTNSPVNYSLYVPQRP